MIKSNHKYIIIILICAVILAIAFYFLKIQKTTTLNKNPINTKPKIVDLFACGDNCPGPAEKYIVKTYEGVKTKEMCDKYGGYFKSFVGWGTTYYCAVENQGRN